MLFEDKATLGVQIMCVYMDLKQKYCRLSVAGTNINILPVKYKDTSGSIIFIKQPQLKEKIMRLYVVGLAFERTGLPIAVPSQL